MEKFVYVFSEEDCDEMIKAGYQLVQFDKKQKFYVFLNEESMKFSLNVDHAFGNTLSFNSIDLLLADSRS